MGLCVLMGLWRWIGVWLGCRSYSIQWQEEQKWSQGWISALEVPEVIWRLVLDASKSRQGTLGSASVLLDYVKTLRASFLLYTIFFSNILDGFSVFFLLIWRIKNAAAKKSPVGKFPAHSGGHSLSPSRSHARTQILNQWDKWVLIFQGFSHHLTCTPFGCLENSEEDTNLTFFTFNVLFCLGFPLVWLTSSWIGVTCLRNERWKIN